MGTQFYVVRSNSSTDDLFHHGIKGQKWGVRRYQNEDGTLTAAGKKRQIDKLGRSGKTVLSKGTELMRVSSHNKTDAKAGTKLYTNPDEDEHKTYKQQIGGSNIIKNGEAFVHKYVANNDITIPSLRTQRKIEGSLIKDKAVQKEIVESLMKKGLSREEAAKAVKPINMGIEYLKVSPWLLMTPLNPAVPIVMATIPASKKEEQLRIIENSMGDVNNKKLNAAFENKLKEQGYNSYRDTNDRNKTIAKKSIVVIDPDKNARLVDSHKITKDEYGKAYADAKVNKNKRILKDVDYEDLTKDGERIYEEMKKGHVLTRERKAENDEILKKFEKEWKN